MNDFHCKIFKMTIYFRGGEYQQRGRGIGGFFRGLWNLFRPVAKSVGSSIVKAATSDTAKSIAKTLGEQALDSTLNMTKDAIAGNELQACQVQLGRFQGVQNLSKVHLVQLQLSAAI